MLHLPVYLDHSATTPVDSQVLEEMLPYFTKHYGNAASRSHEYGWTASEAVDFSRSQVAKLIHAEAKEIIFTSGATEAINLAIKGVADMYASKGNHIIAVQTEHKAVLDSCRRLQTQGIEVSLLSVDEWGLIDLEELQNTIRPETILICVMYANNETGVLQPIRDIAAVAKKNGILFFTDATQAVGKIPVNVLEDGADLMAFSAHKMYGPKGAGALYIRRKDPRVRVTALIDGGGHERGMRSGTPNVPGIVGFGQACDLCRWKMEEDGKRMRTLRDKLEKILLQMEGVVLNGHPQHRLPNICNVSFTAHKETDLIPKIAGHLAVSAGAACTSESLDPSHVLRAMAKTVEEAKTAIRFSLGRYTTEEEIDFAIDTIREIVGMPSKQLS